MSVPVERIVSRRKQYVSSGYPRNQGRLPPRGILLDYAQMVTNMFWSDFGSNLKLQMPTRVELRVVQEMMDVYLEIVGYVTENQDAST